MASVQQALADAQAESKKRFQKEKEDALLAAKEEWKKETESRIIEVSFLKICTHTHTHMQHLYAGSEVGS